MAVSPRNRYGAGTQQTLRAGREEGRGRTARCHPSAGVCTRLSAGVGLSTHVKGRVRANMSVRAQCTSAVQKRGPVKATHGLASLPVSPPSFIFAAGRASQLRPCPLSVNLRIFLFLFAFALALPFPASSLQFKLRSVFRSLLVPLPSQSPRLLRTRSF